MHSPPLRESVLAGVTYWSGDLGPYVWHEFDPERVKRDLRAMSHAGLRVVRTLLPWDVFMPTPHRVEDTRLRDLEVFLESASEEALSVIPVLYAQAIGDCVMLPAYAIDVSVKRPGVRVVTEGVVQPGGPRDQYTDRRMLEAQVAWLDAMLGAFEGHSAVMAWDLGHDPASVMRPRRIDDMVRWASTVAERFHERGQRCMLTLGSRDITTARGVRPAPLAAAVDAIGIDMDPRGLGLSTGALDERPLVFLARLAMRLAGAESPFYAHVGVSRLDAAGEIEDGDQEDGAAASRFADRAAGALAEIGCAARFAAVWSDCGPRTAAVAPFDRHPELRYRGLVDAVGRSSAFGGAWLAHVTNERDRETPAPWPGDIDVSEYYANLPQTMLDLYAAWQRGTSDGPGMLG